MQQPPRDAGAVNSVGRILDQGTKIRLGTPQGLLRSLALGDVAIHDHQLFRFPLGIENHAGGRFQHQPGTIFMLKAVFQGLADSRAAGLFSRSLDSFAILGMNLLEGRGGLQLFGRIS